MRGPLFLPELRHIPPPNTPLMITSQHPPRIVIQTLKRSWNGRASARSDSISSDCSATTASSSAFLAASSSYDGCSGCGIPEPNHDHKPDASTDTPQITSGPDWLLPGRRYRFETAAR